MWIVVVLFVLFALWADKPSSSRPLAPVTDPLTKAINDAPAVVLRAAGLTADGQPTDGPGASAYNVGIVDPSSINGGPV